MVEKLKAKLAEKEKYLETIKTELNACIGQIILLKELIEAEEKK